MTINSAEFKKHILKVKSMTNGKERSRLINEIAKKYDCSVKTIYREAKKKPGKIGMRKIRADAGRDKVVPKKSELQRIDELIKQDYPLREAVKLCEKETGLKISARKLQKIKKELKTKKLNDKSKFGNKIKALIEKLLNADKIAFDRKIPVRFRYEDDKILKTDLTRSDIDFLLMVIAARYNMTQFAEEKKLRVDDNRLLRMKLKYMLADEIEKLQEDRSIEQFDKISQITARLDDSIKNLSPDFMLSLLVIQSEFKSGMTAEEYLSLLEKYEPQVKRK